MIWFWWLWLVRLIKPKQIERIKLKWNTLCNITMTLSHLLMESLMWPEDTAMEKHLLEHSFMRSSIKIDKLILFWIIRKAHKNSMQILYLSQKDTLELLVKALLHSHQGTVTIMLIHTYKLSHKILRKPNVGGLVSWYSLSIAHKKQEHKFNIRWKLPKIIFI